MSSIAEFIKSTPSYIEERITTNTADTHRPTLVIILTVTLSISAVIALIIIAIIIHRRRHSTIRLKKLQNSSRLRQIVVNLSPTSIRLKYSKNRLYLTHPQYQQPRTETVVYNYMNVPAAPVVYYSSKLSLKGETNAAFDESSLKNEQQPILRSLSIKEQPITTLQTEFPVSLQAPVPSITSIFVDAIATHRLSLIENTALEISASTSNNDSSGDSRASYSSSSQKLLLFSQRTEF